MTLLDLRTAMINAIQTALPSLKEVKAHGGRFSLEELKAASARAPSVRVACLGFPDIAQSEAGVKAQTAWGAFVIAGDQTQAHRDALALTLVWALALIIPGNCWSYSDTVDQARQVRADNLFSRELDKNGIALWAVTWRQEIDIAGSDLTELNDFVLCHVDYDINQDGETDLSDEIDLPQ